MQQVVACPEMQRLYHQMQQTDWAWAQKNGMNKEQYRLYKKQEMKQMKKLAQKQTGQAGPHKAKKKKSSSSSSSGKKKKKAKGHKKHSSSSSSKKKKAKKAQAHKKHSSSSSGKKKHKKNKGFKDGKQKHEKLSRTDKLMAMGVAAGKKGMAAAEQFLGPKGQQHPGQQGQHHPGQQGQHHHNTPNVPVYVPSGHQHPKQQHNVCDYKRLAKQQRNDPVAEQVLNDNGRMAEVRAKALAYAKQHNANVVVIRCKKPPQAQKPAPVVNQHVKVMVPSSDESSEESSDNEYIRVVVNNFHAGKPEKQTEVIYQPASSEEQDMGMALSMFLPDPNADNHVTPSTVMLGAQTHYSK